MKKIAIQSREFKLFDRIIARFRGQPGELLSILEEIQKASKHQYLPSPVLEYVAQKTGMPLSRIYSVVTFYSFFNLKPQGRHCLTICRGTACHTKGSKKILDYLLNALDFPGEEAAEGEKIFFTTKDKLFTVRTVACFGQCALAPVVEVDGEIFGHMTVEKIKKIVAGLEKKGRVK